jgi:hypothetical protein
MRRGLHWWSRWWLGFGRGPAGWIASILLGLTTIVILTGAFVAWRIGNAPVSLGFAIPAIEEALSPADGSFSAQLDGFHLRRDKLEFVLEAQGLSLHRLDTAGEPQKTPFATMPIARISLSLAALIHDGLLAAERIVAAGWQMTAERGQNGIELSFAGDAESADDRLSLASLRRLLRDDERLHYLKTVELTDLTFRINDPVLGISWQTEGSWMQLINNQEGLRWGGRMSVAAQHGDLTKFVEAAGTVRWNVTLPAEPAMDAAGETLNAAADEATLEVTLNQLEPSLIIGLFPQLHDVVSWDGAISGTATTKFSLEAIPNSVRFDLTVGAGRMSLPLTGGGLSFAAAKVVGDVDLRSQKLTLRQLSVRHDRGEARLAGTGELQEDGAAAVKMSAGGLHLSWLGRILPAAAMLEGADLAIAAEIEATVAADGNVTDANVQLQTAGGTLTMAEKLIEPLMIGDSKLDLTIGDGGRAYALEMLRLALPRADGKPAIVVSVNGQATKGGAGGLRIATAGLDEIDLKRLWPIGLGEGARVWVVDQVHKGWIPEAVIDVSFHLPDGPTLSPPQDIRIDGRMPVHDVDLTYWPPLPRATGMVAEARITEKLFEAKVTSGSSNGVKVNGGHLLISGIDKGKGYERTELTFDLVGSLSRIMTVLDRPPLRFARYLDLPPSELGGTISGTLTAKFPPVADLDLDDIEIGASGVSIDTLIPQAAFGQDLTDGRFKFKVDKTALSLNGQGAMAGAAVKLQADMKFAASARYRSRFRMQATLDDKARAAMGLEAFPFSTEIVSGPVSIDMTATETAKHGTVIKVAADLTQARMALPMLGWQSPAGEYAAGDAQVRVVNGKLRRVDSFRLTGSRLSLGGEADWRNSQDRRPVVRISELRHGAGTDITAVATPVTGGGYMVSIAGQRLDGRNLIKTMTKSEPAKAKRNENGDGVDVDLRIAAVQLGNGPPLQALRGRVSIVGDDLRTASLAATTVGGGQVDAAIQANGGLVLNASDAGALLEALGVTERLERGGLQIVAKLQRGSGAIDGKLALRGGELTEAPFLMRLLSGGTIDRPKVARHWAIDRLDSDFALDHGILMLEDGQVSGGELGATFRGWIDVKGEKLDIAGAIVPAYSVNRVLRAIPLLGDVLTGGEGLFAANYRATGSLDQPDFGVNPLTALAPGLLRKLFSGNPSQPPQPSQ